MHYLSLFILVASCSFSVQTYTQEHTNLESSKKNKDILWIIEDTFEWDNYQRDISTSTSQDTAAFIMHGLENMGYKLNFIKASGKRVNHFIMNSDNACISNRIKTKERESFSVFSLAHDIYLGLKLYRRSQVKPFPPEVINEKGDIHSLNTLFKYNTKKILAIASGISYGNAIDEQIKAVAEKNLFKRTGGTRLRSLAEMFFRKRVDYVLYYPADMNLIANDNVELESYRLANTSPYILGHVNCSKSQYGNEIIEDINKILVKKYKEYDFYYSHEKWVTNSDLATLREYYIEVFGSIPENEKPN